MNRIQIIASWVKSELKDRRREVLLASLALLLFVWLRGCEEVGHGLQGGLANGRKLLSPNLGNTKLGGVHSVVEGSSKLHLTLSGTGISVVDASGRKIVVNNGSLTMDESSSLTVVKDRSPFAALSIGLSSRPSPSFLGWSLGFGFRVREAHVFLLGDTVQFVNAEYTTESLISPSFGSAKASYQIIFF